ncbi:MAG: helix-turn-helix domain-containing protein, partial [Planctomycetota bacterium]
GRRRPLITIPPRFRRRCGMATSQRALITAAEFAGLLGISPRTLWRLLARGELIEPIRLGGNTRWRLEEVDAWIAEGCPKP